MSSDATSHHRRAVTLTVALWILGAAGALVGPFASGNGSIILAAIAIILLATAIVAVLLFLVCSDTSDHCDH